MPAAKTLSFATCNLYNLNLPGQKMYGRNAWTSEQYESKINWMSDRLKRVDSDIWGFQELWDKKALNQVFSTARVKSKYELLVPPSTNGRSIVCAGAVKKDYLAGDAAWISDFPKELVFKSDGDDPQTPAIEINISAFSRPILRFEVKAHARSPKITVYVVHLKSRLPTPIYDEAWYDKAVHSAHSNAVGAAIATIRRTAEVTALRWLLTKEMKGSDKPVIVLGDLNDSQLSNTLNILTEQPGYLFGFSKGGADNGLYSTATLQEYRSLRDVYYTHIYQNKRESLDHILVSQEFYDNSKKRIWAFKGMDVYNDHLNDTDHKSTGTIDHGIVKATFQYRPAS